MKFARRLMPGCAALAIACVFAQADAQSGPTDNELYAGYCKGVMDAEIEMQGPPEASPSMEKFREHQIEPKQRLQQRFQSYLLSTGVMTDDHRPEATFGLITAIQRGRDDVKQCFDMVITALGQCGNADAECHVRHLPVEQDPVGALPLSPTERQCLAEHAKACIGQLPPCVRKARCSGPDNLPF